MNMDKASRNIDSSELQALLEDASSHKQLNGWKEYQCKLVTPMYSGGVKSGEIDERMPIRASSIRGHLRFWWRIAFGGDKSPEVLFKEESELWGGINKSGPKKSKVYIRVKSKNITRSNTVRSDNRDEKGVQYAFGCAGIENGTLWVKPEFEFTLFIRCKQSYLDQVNTALRLWGSFGGIGGRTRRGFGAIEIVENNQPLTPFSKEEFEKLGGKLVLNNLKQSSEEAWSNAVSKLYEFRQAPDIARRDKPGPAPSISFWPEPDQLRWLTNKTDGHTPVHDPTYVFPRAAFGMPITFQFKNGGSKEPKTTNLLPEGKQRMASPLILRPYGAGREWQAMALLLPKWEQALRTPLALYDEDNEKDDSGKSPLPWNHYTPEEQKTRADQIKPMKGRGTNPLEAFLEYFQKGISR